MTYCKQTITNVDLWLSKNNSYQAFQYLQTGKIYTWHKFATYGTKYK